jgi:tetratricopeptide (TPR) repeat protein
MISGDGLKHTLLREIVETSLQCFLTFVVVIAGFFSALYARQLVTTDNLFIEYITNQIILGSLFTAVVFTVVYKLGTFTFFGLISLILRNNKPNKVSKDKLGTFLMTVFIVSAVILGTQPLRPVIQEAITDESQPYFDAALVKYDAIPTAIILGLLAIPIILGSYKKESKPEIFTKIATLLLIGGMAVYSNVSPNYLARISETREAWLLRDWNKQAELADVALKNASTPEEKASALYWLGVAANRNKNYLQAIEYQLEAIATDPNYEPPYSSISSAFRLTGDYDQALQYANQCLTISTQYAWCYYALGSIYSDLGDWDLAVDSFKKATLRSPHNSELKDSFEYTQKYIERLDSDDQLAQHQVPPGCSAEPIVDQQGMPCNGKNRALRFSYNSSELCLQIENDNCHGSGVKMTNNCSADKQVTFDNEVIPTGTTRFLQFNKEPDKIVSANSTTFRYPTTQEIIYAKGAVDSKVFTVSYTQTPQLCE